MSLLTTINDAKFNAETAFQLKVFVYPEYLRTVGADNDDSLSLSVINDRPDRQGEGRGLRHSLYN